LRFSQRGRVAVLAVPLDPGHRLVGGVHQVAPLASVAREAGQADAHAHLHDDAGAQVERLAQARRDVGGELAGGKAAKAQARLSSSAASLARGFSTTWPTSSGGCSEPGRPSRSAVAQRSSGTGKHLWFAPLACR